jgi:dihydrofolate synthase/folylpolyglutamate synthase
MVESILRAAKLRTGLFTSPHLHSYTERVQIDGRPLAEDEWARLTAVLRDSVEAEGPLPGSRSLVTFDLLTALAFLAFQQHGVDCQVLEVGLGGRVDSTNVFGAGAGGPANTLPHGGADFSRPRQAEAYPAGEGKEVCAVTAIGLEHTDVLGDTVEKIAAEKAGVIRPGSTVVIGPQPHGAAREVIVRAAADARCPTVDVAQSYSWRRVSHDLDGQTFRLDRPRGALRPSTAGRLRLPLLGQHQLENAACAVACADALTERGLPIVDEAIEKGLASVSWPGRMEILSRRPVVVADGAHSRDAARRLRECLTDYLSCRGAFLIVGASAGKDVAGVAQELAPVARRVTAVRANHPRAMAPQEVAAAFIDVGVRTELGEEVGEALKEAMAGADDKAVICLAGSLFVAAEGRAHLGGLPQPP